MSNAQMLPLAEDRVLRVGFRTERDPGDAGELEFSNKGTAIISVVTAGAETRVLPAASHYAVGTRLIVLFETDGGDLSITGAEATVVLDSAGDYAEFIVTDNNGTKAWRAVSNTTMVGEVALLPADAGTVTLRTDSVANLAADVKTVLDNLETAGLIDATGVTV